jgi:hypothetical protein
MFIHVLELVLFKVKMMSCDIVGDCCLTPNKQFFFLAVSLPTQAVLRVLHVGTYYRSNQA